MKIQSSQKFQKHRLRKKITSATSNAHWNEYDVDEKLKPRNQRKNDKTTLFENDTLDKDDDEAKIKQESDSSNRDEDKYLENSSNDSSRGSD